MDTDMHGIDIGGLTLRFSFVGQVTCESRSTIRVAGPLAKTSIRRPINHLSRWQACSLPVNFVYCMVKTGYYVGLPPSYAQLRELSPVQMPVNLQDVRRAPLVDTLKGYHYDVRQI